jgi:catechol 2,3-dioxygenase-like lactoylglutathione lyase family enzyme
MTGLLKITIAAVLVSVASISTRAGSSQSTPPRPRLTGINHVAFRVSDLQASRRFYSEILGLQGRSPSDGSRAMYSVGTRQGVLLESGLPASDDERLSHVAFETPDIPALKAYLTSRGTAVQPVPTCQEGAIRVVDPDGHAIEFVAAQWPPERLAVPSDGALSSRLLHAGLTIRDEALAHRFYRDSLAFSEIWRGGRKEGVTQWINMRVPDSTDYLEYMLVTSPPDRRQRGVLHHLCLLVPDIQRAWEEAVRRTPEPGRTTLPVPQVGVNGRWQLNLFDPDGTRVELMEPFRIR